jgi:predicted house-cleaning noncanonical NTP pyrophosphatase (MazG superfamily)
MDYKKLVRDEIPEIIVKDGHIPETRTLGDEEFLKALWQKLLEEAKEAQATTSRAELLEELADLTEVIRTIGQTASITPEEIEQVRVKKETKRGGFSKRIFLIRTTDPSENP